MPIPQCYPRFRSSFGLRKLAQKLRSESVARGSPLAASIRPASNRKSARDFSSFVFFPNSSASARKRVSSALLEPAERCIKHCQRRQVGIGMSDLLKADGRVFEMFRAILDLGREQVYAPRERVGSGRNVRASFNRASASSKCRSSSSNCANSKKAGARTGNCGLSALQRTEMFQRAVASPKSKVEPRQIPLGKGAAWLGRIPRPAIKFSARRFSFASIKLVQFRENARQNLHPRADVR